MVARAYRDPDRYLIEWTDTPQAPYGYAPTLAAVRQAVQGRTADVYRALPSGLWLVRVFTRGREARV